jgi:hypothetical protein
MKNNEMGGACGTYGSRRGAYRVWWGDMRERNHLEDLGVDGETIFKLICKKWNGSMDWTDMAQERDR